MYHLFLVTPEKTVIDGLVHAITIPGTEGYFEILKGHAAIIASLTIGQVTIIDKDKATTLWAITGGVVEVLDNKVNLLADAIESAPMIDVKRAEAALQRAKKHLEESEENPAIDIARAKKAKKRAENRLKIAG